VSEEGLQDALRPTLVAWSVVLAAGGLVTWLVASPSMVPSHRDTPNTVEAQAQSSSARTGPVLSAPRGHELHTEDGSVYPYIERTYEPPHVLPLVSTPPDESELNSPEAVVSSLGSALRNLDWEWYQSLWDEPSRKYTEKMFAAAKYAPAQRVAKWRENYFGKEMHITRRIDMEGYALVSIAPTDGDQDMWSRVPPLTTRRDPSGRWWLSHDLRAHPIPAMGMGLEKVQVVDRGPANTGGNP